MNRYFIGVSQEEFPPEELLRQAVAAEQAGFDGISSSDHLQPWWEPGESGHTWPWLRAARPATPLSIGTGVPSTRARRRRPGDVASDRHGRHVHRRALPPGADRAGLDDARAAVPGPPVPRHRL